MRALLHVQKRRGRVPKSSESRISCARPALGHNPVQYYLGGEGEPAGGNVVVMVAGGESLEGQNRLGGRWNGVSVGLCRSFVCVECAVAWEERVVDSGGEYRGFGGFVLGVEIQRGVWEWKLDGREGIRSKRSSIFCLEPL